MVALSVVAKLVIGAFFDAADARVLDRGAIGVCAFISDAETKIVDAVGFITAAIIIVCAHRSIDAHAVVAVLSAGAFFHGAAGAGAVRVAACTRVCQLHRASVFTAFG